MQQTFPRVQLDEVDSELRERLNALRQHNRTMTVRFALAMIRKGKHMYAGTVPAHVKAKRRARGKVAKQSRKANRG